MNFFSVTETMQVKAESISTTENGTIGDVRQKTMNSNSKNCELLSISVEAMILFFRSSQYVIKTHGETAAMGFPPLYIVYYNMWEVLARLLYLYKENTKDSYMFTSASLILRDKLGDILISMGVRDVSSRIFDITHIEKIVKDQFKKVEQMGTQNSIDRLSIMRTKYYLEDDYEDNMFNLDWFYNSFFAPGAAVYRSIVKSEMKNLREEKNVKNSEYCIEAQSSS